MKCRTHKNRTPFIESLEGRRLLSGTYDVANDFSLAANPNGPWSYGELSGGGFSLDSTATGNGQWEGTHSQTFTESSIVGGDGSRFNGYATGPVVLMDSGVNSGVEATVRWTAPAAGTYSIQGTFTPMNDSGSVPVEVLHNGSVAASGTISQPADLNSPPGSVPIDQSVSIKAGDTIDFVVGHGQGGYNADDDSELEATITQTSSGGTGGGGGGGGGISNNSALQVTSTGRLPAAVLAGGKIAPITRIAHITNSGSAAVDGPVTVSILLSSDPSGASGGTSVASLTRKIKLKAHRSLSIPITLRSLPSSATGTQYVLTEITDPSGNTAFTAAATAISVEPPQVDLSGTFAKVPISVKAGHKLAFTLSVVNSGTTPASGSLGIDIQASHDGTLDSSSIDLGTITRRVNIKPGKRMTLRFSESLPGSAGPYYLVANLDPGNVFADVNPANNVFASATAVKIG